jgi:hypothetical protein
MTEHTISVAGRRYRFEVREAPGSSQRPFKVYAPGVVPFRVRNATEARWMLKAVYVELGRRRLAH